MNNPSTKRRTFSRRSASVNYLHTGPDALLSTFRGLRINDRGTNAWFEDLVRAVEDSGDAAFTRVRAPLFEKTARPHVFSAEERRRMDNYESIDYSEAQSLTYKARMANRKEERRWIKWIMYIAVGISVGVWSVLLFQTLDFIANLKLRVLQGFIVTHDKESHGGATAPSGVTWRAVGFGYSIIASWAVATAVLSSLCCVLRPSAAGSGVPDVMAYMNGVMFPRIFNIWNLVIKTISCILAVSSGLPVGAEGPIIHIGSLIGAGLPTGRSRTLRCSASSLLSTFRNPRDMRDFISAGAACGMTSAFSSPIGGMLFVMEEMATFFSVKLGCLVFVSCLSCMCVIQIINSYLTGWFPSNRSSRMSPGDFRSSAIAMFITNTTPDDRVPMNLLTFIPTVVGAIALGLLSVCYTVYSVKFTRWRSRCLFPYTFLRVLEPCIVALIYATACYMLPLAFECVEIPAYVVTHKEELNIELFTAFCADREKTFNPLATLTLTSPYNGIRLLFSRRTTGLISWYMCLIHLLLYAVGSSYAGGMFISCGTVIPSLFIGAVGGRLIGVIFGSEVWADPGVMALIGSASYFSGISRLSFSLIVIMMELTSDLTHITCLMVGVIVARALANRFCHSFYHSLLEVKAVPFLEAQASVHKLDMFCAKDIMTSPVVALHSIETVSHLMEVLNSTVHNGFPVLSERGTYQGVISRSQLNLLIWFMYMRDAEAHGELYSECSNDNISACPEGRDDERVIKSGRNSANLEHWLVRQPHASHKDLNEVSECIFWKRLPSLPPSELMPDVVMQAFVDLSPYVDLSAYYVRDVMCVSRTYYIFRHLGLRHLPVVDRANHVVGIITRTNLMGDRLHERLKAAETQCKHATEDRAGRSHTGY